jgi:hypothetical protein
MVSLRHAVKQATYPTQSQGHKTITEVTQSQTPATSIDNHCPEKKTYIRNEQGPL